MGTLQDLKDNIMGTDEQNAKAQAFEDMVAAKDPSSPQAKYQRLIQTGMSMLGSKKPEPQENNPIINMGKGAAEGLKQFKQSQDMKKGGKVRSSASKRADGCITKGHTKGRFV